MHQYGNSTTGPHGYQSQSNTKVALMNEFKADEERNPIPGSEQTEAWTRTNEIRGLTRRFVDLNQRGGYGYRWTIQQKWAGQNGEEEWADIPTVNDWELI